MTASIEKNDAAVQSNVIVNINQESQTDTVTIKSSQVQCVPDRKHRKILVKPEQYETTTQTLKVKMKSSVIQTEIQNSVKATSISG